MRRFKPSTFWACCSLALQVFQFKINNSAVYMHLNISMVIYTLGVNRDQVFKHTINILGRKKSRETNQHWQHLFFSLTCSQQALSTGRSLQSQLLVMLLWAKKMYLMLSGELQAADNVCKEEMQHPGEGAVEEPVC